MSRLLHRLYRRLVAKVKAWTSTAICRDLDYVHPELLPKVQAVITDVNSHLDTQQWRLAIFETARSRARQQSLVKAGTSMTMNSKHCLVPSEAVDVVFQRNDARRGWTWVWPPADDPKWALVESSAVAHGIHRLRRNGKTWDHPHLQYRP